MKKFLLFSSFFALTSIVNTAFSQTWVDKMQDPTINFYDVQKAFNDYYKDSEPKFRETEKLKEAERAKLPSAKAPLIPAKGVAVPTTVPEALQKGKMEGGWKAYKRWENQMESRLYPSGDRSVMVNAWNDYLNDFYAGAAGGTRAGGPTTPTTLAANWTIIGPTTAIPSGGGGAGRCNFVRFDPLVSTTIYVGSPGGGLWKTTNSGTTWTTGTDQLAVIGTTDLAIHPTSPLIQYLATGDGEAQDTYSIGVLKTTNGGTTWNPTGLSWLITQGRTISRLLINPQNPNTLFAATSNGVYRTRNGGVSWVQIASAAANMKDIEYRPGDTTIVYATSTTLFYRSTNAGTTFATTSTGLPTAASVSRLSVAVTAANSAYVYVLAANTAFGFQGLYRSTDNGATFTARSTTPNILGYSNTGATAGGQGWYDLALAVSPLNADQVMVGGINIWRSTNGGTGWTLNAEWTGSGAPYVHADVHAIEYLPGSGTTYFAGCDGGLFRTTTSGTSWSDLSNGLQISQAYRIGLSATNANLLNTGWQDNGTARWVGGTAWNRPLGGDGMESIIDWSNANIQYGELYYGDIRKTTTGGNYTTQIVASGGTGVNADGDWVTPYCMAPSNALTLFVGKAQVYKSTTGGGGWTQVGTISGGTGNVIAIANAASNINYIYAAKIDKFYACTTGAAFIDRTAGLPTASAAISYIAIDPLNANRVWVTFSGYSAANKVWYSADAGVTWSNYTTGLPNLPANCIVYQGSSVNDPLYVGTDVGVYYRDNTAGSWTPYNTGLPNVSVRELEIHYTALKLRAATFGRSIWQSDLASPGTSPPVADFTASRVNICVGDCINFTDISAGSPTSWSWTFTGGTPGTSTIQNPTNICYNTAGTYAVTLVATNANGSDTETKTAYITVSSPIALPLVEGFQATFIPPNWQLINPDADFAWTQSTACGGFGTSTQCAAMDNLTPPTSTAGYLDEMITPKYNFTGVSSATMTFDVAYCRYNATYFDSLIVFVSTNCGSTWSRVYAKGSTLLSTAPDNATTVFVPTAAQWRTETVSMTPYAGQANVMVKFQNKSGWGQMLYLDNINITGVSAPVASVVIAQTTGTNPTCVGASATFTATPTNGGSAPTYQWYINGTPVGGATASTFTSTTLANGNIVTCVMVSNLPGVTGSPATSNAITMTVNAIPAAPTVGSNTPVCVGSTILLTSNTIAGATYSWTGPAAFTSALEDPTRPAATLAMAGTYSLTVTVAGCTSPVATTTVVVNAVPATPTAGSNTPVCAGATILLTSNTVAGATYAWTGPAAFSSALEDPTRPAATVAMAGTYSLTVTVGGCTSAVATTAVVVNAIPATPTAGSNSPVCEGNTISLTSNTVAGATYAWTGPAAFASALEDPSIPLATLAMAGTYSLTLTVAGCASAQATTTVVINAAPTTPTAGSNSPVCMGSTILLTSNTVAGATYSWTGPSAFGSSVEDPTRPGATAAMAGTYSLTVTVGGCTSAIATTVVAVNAVPGTPTAGSNSPVCAGSTILLTSNTVAGATYSWTGPSAYSSALEDPTRPAATAAMAGTYSLTVTVGGCTSAMATATVVVNTSPATPTAGSNTPVCVGSTILLTSNTVAGATYSWTGPLAYTSALEDPSIASSSAGMAGTYSLTITVGGCTSAIATTTVAVNTAAATPTAGSNSPVCVGSTILLTSNTVAGATYSWTGPLAYTSALEDPSIASATTAMSGTYSLTVTVGGCTSAVATTVVAVNTTPATPTVGSSTPDCVGQTISLTSNTIAGATYSWTGPAAFSSSLEDPTRPSATLAMAGTYSLTVTVGGCTSAVATTTVVVNALPATPVPSINGSTTPAAICAGGTITLTTPNLGGGYTYSWTGPNSYAAAVRNPPALTSVTTVMGGTYSLTVTNGGCTSLAGTVTIVVNPIPAAPTVGSNSPVCTGSTILLTSNTVAGATYAWTGPLAYTSALEDPSRPSATAGMAGTYSLTVTVLGCTSPVSTVAVVVSGSVVPTNSIVASPTGPICSGTSVTFTATAGGGGTTPTYQWQLNGLNVGTGGTTYTSTTLANGDIVTCILTSSSPCAAPITATSNAITMTVNPTVTPTISIVASPTGTICSGTVVNFTATITNGGAAPTYQWQINGANVGTNSPLYSSALLNNGDIITCILGSNAVCPSPVTLTSNSISMTVTPTVTPTISIVASPAGAICAGTSVTFTASITNGGTTPVYQWQVNGSNVGTNSPTYVSSTLTNGQIVTCILTSNATCPSPSATVTSNAITMTVNPVVVPSVTIVASPTGAICAGTSVTFTATPTNGGTTPTYQWQVNGLNVGTGGTTYTSTTLANGNIVTCIMTSNAACPSTATATSNAITMTVNATVTPSVSVVASPAGPICAGTSVLFTATSTNGGTTPTYQWQVNGTNVGTGGTTYTTTTLANGDIVTCILTSNATCASPLTATSTGITMVVNPIPPTPTISVSGTTLTSSSATGNQWYLNGVLIAGATNQNYTFTSNGTYTVIVTTSGCASAESAPEVIINVGISDASNQYGLNIYPNPSDGNFNITFNVYTPANYTLELTNALGQLIYKEELKNFSGNYNKPFSVVDYGKGVYTIILTNDKHDVVKKIIVY